MQMQISHKTLVVLDLCILRARPEDFVGPDEGLVIPDALIVEVMTGNRVDAEPAALGRWLKRFADRVYIGSYWWDLIKAEPSCNKLARPEEAINGAYTVEFRKWITAEEPTAWPEMFKAMRQSEFIKTHGYTIGRARFMELVGLFENWVSDSRPDWIATAVKGTKKDWATFVRQEDIAADVARVWMQLMDGMDAMARYNSEPWKRALIGFPDRFAIGRWSRLLLWYMMAWVRKQRRDFENNWDDMHYAFVASYTGHLATRDRGMREAVTALFPNCRIRGGND
jgi:hypothetical protein